MQLTIFIDSLWRAKTLRRFVQIKVKRALRRHRAEIYALEVSLRDVNGVKGGIDKECKVKIATTDGSQIITSAQEVDAQSALSRCLRTSLMRIRKLSERKQQKGGARLAGLTPAT